jgi:alpha-tubulin suppressor-like RCC1 family protein
MKPRHAAPALLLCAATVLSACSSAGAASPAPLPETSHSPAPSLPASADRVYQFGVVGSLGKIRRLEHDRPAPVPGIRGHVVQVASSNSDSYALTSNGTVWAWGVASLGELGDGRLVPYVTKAVRVTFPPGVRIVTLANPMPFDGALAIDSNGRAWGWGLNESSDLCLSGRIHSRPARLPLSHVTLATGARTHSLLYSGGRVYACGSGEFGELGTGSTANSARPAAVKGLPAGVRVTSLTSSWGGSGALLSDGDYYDWGYNATGQLGDRSTANSDKPVEVSLPAAADQVSQGGSNRANGQTVALLSNGTVWAWGNDADGQLGNGSTLSTAIPVSVSVPDGVIVRAVDCGGYACYAIDGSRGVWAWGGNKDGQLGTGSSPAIQTTPVSVGIHLTQLSATATNVVGFR